MTKYFVATLDLSSDDPIINEDEIKEAIFKLFRKSNDLDLSYVAVQEDK